MVKKPILQGMIKPDITPPSALREQARYLKIGRMQARAKWWQVILALIAAMALATVITIAVIKVMWATPNLDGGKYQAVFLEDGKVFFGKLKNTDGAYITLENAYYTKSTQQGSNSDTADQTALVKVGSESYGPENSIQIARSQILFFQNLRDDSQVTRAINNRNSQ